MNINNLHTFKEDHVRVWTSFGFKQDLDAIPPEHQEQIVIMNTKASDFLTDFLKNQR